MIPFHTRMLRAKYSWNWEEDTLYLNAAFLFLLFLYYLPLEKGFVLHLKKIGFSSPLPNDSLCQVWLKVDLEKDENNYAFTVIRVQRIVDVSFANKESYNEYTMLFIFMKHYFFIQWYGLSLRLLTQNKISVSLLTLLLQSKQLPLHNYSAIYLTQLTSSLLFPAHIMRYRQYDVNFEEEKRWKTYLFFFIADTYLI